MSSASPFSCRAALDAGVRSTEGQGAADRGERPAPYDVVMAPWPYSASGEGARSVSPCKRGAHAATNNGPEVGIL
jgi:hypothetical protein